MRAKSIITVLGAFAVAAIALCTTPACSSSGGCSAASKCSADPKPTTDTINTCNALSADAVCGSDYTNLSSCEQAQQVCAADNTTDVSATTNALEANCKTQLTSYSACCAANLTACKGTGDGG